jgi:hypothetical protein
VCISEIGQSGSSDSNAGNSGMMKAGMFQSVFLWENFCCLVMVFSSYESFQGMNWM